MCIRSSLDSVRFGQLLRCPHKCFVDIMKVYIERNNLKLNIYDSVRKCRLYSRLLLRSEEFNASHVFTLG